MTAKLATDQPNSLTDEENENQIFDKIGYSANFIIANKGEIISTEDLMVLSLENLEYIILKGIHQRKCDAFSVVKNTLQLVSERLTDTNAVVWLSAAGGTINATAGVLSKHLSTQILGYEGLVEALDQLIYEEEILKDGVPHPMDDMDDYWQVYDLPELVAELLPTTSAAS